MCSLVAIQGPANDQEIVDRFLAKCRMLRPVNLTLARRNDLIEPRPLDFTQIYFLACWYADFDKMSLPEHYFPGKRIAIILDGGRPLPRDDFVVIHQNKKKLDTLAEEVMAMLP